MNIFKEYKFGIISLSVLIIGLAVGLILVQQQQNLQKKAAEDLINAFEITDTQGNSLPCSNQGCETNSLEVRIKVKDLEALTQ